MTGAIVSADDIRGGGVRALPIPDYALDIALRLRRMPQVAARGSNGGFRL